MALAVSGVLGVWDTRDLDISDVPPLLGGTSTGAIEAMGRLDEQLLIVLHASRLVPDELWAELDACDPFS